jgi:hypothetical protein
VITVIFANLKIIRVVIVDIGSSAARTLGKVVISGVVIVVCCRGCDYYVCVRSARRWAGE